MTSTASPDLPTTVLPPGQRVAPSFTLAFERQWVDLRPWLLRFARLQLRHASWAEDAVSETVLAAMAKPQAFQARSQLKKWLVGILKHKRIDALGRTISDPCSSRSTSPCLASQKICP